MTDADDGELTQTVPGRTHTTEVVVNPTPHLVVLTGDRAGRHVPLTDRVLMGRGVDCDLQLDVDDISRRHAEVRVTAEGQYVVEDHSSQNGTWVNGVPVELQALHPGDRVRLGAKTLVMLSLFGDVEGELLHQQRMESLGLLAGSIAHDFNNLMAVVLGNAEFLNVLPKTEQLGTEVVSSALEDLRAAAQHAADLTRQLLTLARKSPLDEQVIEVDRLVDDVVRILRRKLGAKIDVQIAVRGPLVVVGDPAQLRQVLLNLCVNAQDAMPEGGSLSLRAWREANSPGPESVNMEVEDTGMGLSKEACGRVFEPFYSGKALGRGTGLGLAIVDRIVKNHGGEVSVRSELGVGTTFRVSLPVRTKADRATPPTRPFQTQPRPSAGPMAQLLVIDNDDLHARALLRNLGHLGYRTIRADSADEGLRLAQAMSDEVDLVIVDSDLRGLGALETCKALREHHPNMKLVLTCGATNDAVDELVRAVTPDYVLLKPYQLHVLRGELLQLL